MKSHAVCLESIDSSSSSRERERLSIVVFFEVSQKKHEWRRKLFSILHKNFTKSDDDDRRIERNWKFFFFLFYFFLCAFEVIIIKSRFSTGGYFI